MEEKKKLIIHTGPTAVGKTKLSIEIARMLNAEIISADSMQVYKELNIGTAKPSKDELKDPKYKMYDVVSINEEYSVSRYQHDVRPLIDNCNNHILVGGTGLYLKALLFDYKFDEEDPMPKDYLSSFSNDELYSKLEQIDKEDALKIGRNNRKRLVRTLNKLENKEEIGYIREEKYESGSTVPYNSHGLLGKSWT